jgi:lactate dehydrogenase-like 2-hydroxyacid dehydrogenase
MSGRAYSNYAAGYDNVDVAAATRHGIAAGNVAGILMGFLVWRQPDILS